MENTLHRIKLYADRIGLKNKDIDRDMHLSSGAFARQLKENKTVGVDKLEYFLLKHEDINPEWLILGIGDMLRTSKTRMPPISDKVEESASPYGSTHTHRNFDYIKKEVFDNLLDNIASLNRKIGALEHQLAQAKKDK